ncbi:Cell division transporter, ATP-binding protein FtsE (TC 3.A.5.1.1) [invertebrate metagenome]|uniref:Cell division transporter, ATP-binding protein FtsE (TC 3.A.5.1.1) n=1 Tax=invertebrate metagenome TaxID=1711999 RepID=A0A484HBZ3_9ZZZZ
MPNTSHSSMVVRFEGVGLQYRHGQEDILRNITFSLTAGSFAFLTGPSGSGKSSLLSLMYLAKRPSRGFASLFGQDISLIRRQALPAIRRRLGVVFQEFRLLDHLSTLDNVALPLRVAGMREEEIMKHVPEILAWIGLANYLHAKPPTLSGGQKQRMAIARAVIGRPDLLLADEPTGSVDDCIARRILHLFIELNKLGTTIIIATHNEHLVRRFNFPCMHLESGSLIHTPDQDSAISGGS